LTRYAQPQRSNLSRRSLLAAGVVGTASVLLSTDPAKADEADPAPESPIWHHDVEALDPSELQPDGNGIAAMASRSTINGAPLYYEPSQARNSFTFENNFYNQLVRWTDGLSNLIPASWGGLPTRIYSYGAYVNKPGMHGLGRGFDIASVSFTAPDGTFIKGFDCRYDKWRNGNSVHLWRRRYWTLSASLHRSFRHVITYLYNTQHHNHIHVDNDIYGVYTNASFSTGSRTQVLHVQAVCRYVWGHATTIDGNWGSQTQSHSTAVLRRVGRSSGTIVSDPGNWQVFNRATVEQGSNKVTY
jgi:hypothetical protein